MNPRPGIDILKFLAVTAVIVIHVVSRYQQTNILIAVDQLQRFCVPLFVALSGFGLALGYTHKAINLLDFFRKRALRLLPWYLFFATVIIFAVTYIFHENFALYDHLAIWRLYVLGRADIHLYFVPMILQLYLLFPILLVLFKKFPPIIFVILTFFWQVIWYFLISQQTETILNNNSLWPDYQQYVHFASWIFYFVLGMYLAGQTNSFGKKWLVPGFLIAAVGLVWSTLNSFGLVSSGINIIVAQRFTRLPVLLYATGVIIMANYFISTSQLLVRLGKVSFIVYLSHTLILRLFFYFPGFTSSLGLLGTIISIILTSFLVGLLFDAMGKRITAKIRQNVFS